MSKISKILRYIKSGKFVVIYGTVYNKNGLFDFWIWTYSVLSYFIHAEVGILNVFLKKELRSFALLQNDFYKEVNPGNSIATDCNYVLKFEKQNFIPTCMKLLITFYWFSNIQENEEELVGGTELENCLD